QGLYCVCGKRGKGIGQNSIVAEDPPKDIRHGKGDSVVGHRRESYQAFAQPLYGGPVAAARAGSRLAGVIDNELAVFRPEDFCAERSSTTEKRSAKSVAHIWRKTIAIPIPTCLLENLLQRMSVSHVSLPLRIQ